MRFLPEEKMRETGRGGESRAVDVFSEWGFALSRPDYFATRQEAGLLYGEQLAEDEDIEIEIKAKRGIFHGPPFAGHGADVYQIKKRLRRWRKYGFKQFLLIVQTWDGCMYGQWVQRLEAGPKHDTRNGIRIYQLESFFEIPNIFGGAGAIQ